MSGVISAVEWTEPEDESDARYKARGDLGTRRRGRAVWLVRGGRSAREAAGQQ